MSEEVKQDIKESGMAKVEVAVDKAGSAVGGFAQKMHEWFSGHPGAAIALAAGIVIGWVIGFLWPR